MKLVKRLISSLLILLLLLSTASITVFADGFNPGGNEGSFSHGSATIVTEDMLKTEDDINPDYDVNTSTQAKASEGLYSKLFVTDAIQDVKITIDTNNWNYLLQNAIDKPNVLADSVSIGNEAVEYCAIKTKGNLTLNQVWNSQSDRFSFTVNFGKYIKKKNGYSDTQNFYGISKLALNNIYGDASLMKEYLSYKLMTEMGVDTPYYALVNLYINDEFYGVYMMVESIDSALTQRTIGEKSDYLVKPEQSGGDLVYDTALDAYINEDGDFDFEGIEYPTSSSNPLYKYSGLWENDEDTFNEVLNMLPTVFKWMKTLNTLSNAENCNSDEYKEQLESIIDVDKLIRYFAVNTYLVNLDSYQSEKMQNYALYINESGYADVLPWDYNFSFGGYGVNSASDMVNFSITNPLSNCTLSERPLLNVILQNEEYNALYQQYLKDCTIIASEGGTTSNDESYNAKAFSSAISDIYEKLNSIYANDPTAFYTASQYKTATDNLKQLILDRSTAVLKQLSGDNTKVETSVNLNAIGSVTGGGGGNPGGNPGNIPSMEQNTLTDNETGIKITGAFSADATIAITKVTSGDKYNTVKNTISSENYIIYNISLTMGNMPGGGNVPTPPEGNQGGNMPTPPEGENQSGDIPIMPGEGNQSGGPQMGGNNPPMAPGNQSYTISFPALNDNDIVMVYSVSEDGSLSTPQGVYSDGVYTITCSSLGDFAVVYSSNPNNNSSGIVTGIIIGAIVVIVIVGVIEIIRIIIKKKKINN